ncbi:Gfo/Idh/MocA family oxidoreductase [Martelella lutilitoris]|uniref:Gfo/Idh/MocA family oxidoreductase n=1 Tax=Martelella lutilitoris TaxID=2583532 RepID=A0A7T7KNH1_9HYPH|nr:Gfo/Idh/MocA family oxidoreductase [Martelella lutilitoris]QQM31939.1 Gfo/Idh/MocA family oxidoreductase [Martelella lutilitoris]
MTRTLKVAVVGLGIGRNHIQNGYRTNTDRFEVAALCDLDEALLKANGAEFGIERLATDYLEIVGMDDIDVIDICTPPATHKTMIVAALQAGKHVICEKPLVGSLADIDELLDAESRSSGHVMPIMQYRYNDGAQKARHIIASGLAGKPLVATCEVHWLRGPDYYEKDWRRSWSGALGGILMNHAIHANDLMFYLLGPVRSLFARTATRVNRVEVEDCASISVELECGALATTSATLGSVEPLSRMRLCFENVTIETDSRPDFTADKAPWRFVPANAAIGSKIDEALAGFTPPPSGFAGQMQDFHKAICEKTPLPLTLGDARQSLDFATAAYWSAKTYSAVALPILPDHPFYNGWQNAF